MGKKSRTKKGRSHSPAPVRTSAPAQASTSAGFVPESLQQGGQAYAPKRTAPLALDIHTEYIRRDILRILILLAAVAVVLAVLAAVNAQSPVLGDAGRKLAQFLGLQ